MQTIKLLMAVTLLIGSAVAQVAPIPNTIQFKDTRTSVNAALANAASITGNYSNPAWITSLAYAKITGVPTFAATKTPVSHQWLASYDASTGLWTQTQPAFADISGTVASGQLPFPASANKGGVLTTACTGGQVADGYQVDGTPHCVTVAGGAGSTPLTNLCSIDSFSPVANGTTDDSAVFTTAAATCSMIMLTAGKQYAIGTNLTLASGIVVIGPPSGGPFVVKTGVTLTLNGTLQAPTKKVFTLQGTGTVLIGALTPSIPVEWFGAAGDGTTDDTAAFLASVSARSGGGGYVDMLGRDYLTTAPITISQRGTNLRGTGRNYFSGGSRILNTAATGDVIAVTNGGSFCPYPTISPTWFNILERFTVARTVASTAGAGINLANGCLTQIEQINIFDTAQGFYLHNTAAPLIQSTQVIYTATSGSAARNAYEVDSSSATSNPSVRIKFGNVTGTGSNVIGLYHHGDNLADLFVNDFETATTDYGIKVVSTAATTNTPFNFHNGDMHLRNLIFDQTKVAGLYISNVIGGGVPNVVVDNLYCDAATASVPCADIENSRGVAIIGGQVRSQGTGGIGVKINGEGSNRVLGLKIDLTPIPIQLSSTSFNSLSTNTITGTGAITTAIALTGATNNVLVSNVIKSYGSTFTNGITFDGTSNNNVAWPNIIDSGTVTNPFVNSGTGNITRVPTVIAVGSKTLNTTTVSSSACGTAQTATATGTVTTDMIVTSFSGDPTAITGYTAPNMLTIIPYPTADTVNFKVCNNTAAGITPGAVTLNWQVVR
jgi:hypothetical protein